MKTKLISLGIAFRKFFNRFIIGYQAGYSDGYLAGKTNGRQFVKRWVKIKDKYYRVNAHDEKLYLNEREFCGKLTFKRVLKKTEQQNDNENKTKG